MKTLLSVLLLVIAAAAYPAQTAQPRSTIKPNASPASKPAARVYQLGTKSVLIPEPDGFEEATSQFDLVQTFFGATEVPANELLAVHTSPEDTARLKSDNFTGGLNFYTKVSVSRRLKGVDTTEADFQSFVTAFQNEGEKLLDPNGQAMKTMLKDIEKNLSDLSDTNVTVDMSQPKYLGDIYRTQSSFGVLLLMNLQIQDESRQSDAALMLCGASIVRVKQRLLYVYTYKRFRTAADADTLRDFTKRWLDKIIAANKG